MKEAIESDIEKAIQALQSEGALPNFELPTITITEPKTKDFGEYTCNIALVLASAAKLSPLVLAEKLQAHLTSERYVASVAAPGYLNFWLQDSILTECVTTILAQKEQYGSGQKGTRKVINNEFISANPTGPLHIGNGRGGYFGDTLTRLLRKVGHQVTSEYYINDGGEQITKLGHSVLKDEEAVYAGEYIEELHKNLGASGEPAENVGREAARMILENSIQKTVADSMGITFDTWTSEYELLQSGKVAKALELLQERGLTYHADDALWLRTTDFGDDKDRVLTKSDGSYTYFASEAGHVLQYLEKGVEVIIETFGADHHGYTKRFEIVAKALGFTGEVHFTLMQMVQLEKEGAPVRMSKRAGNTVTIDDLIERVGPDVVRFFFLMYSPDTHMTFDLGLAEERSQRNPVFYVQYAHARMASILTKAGLQKLNPSIQEEFTHSKERELARELYLFPEFLERAAGDYAPHRLTQYALRLADLFHSFYAAAQVIDDSDKKVSEHRLALVLATKIVLAETLHLLGIKAPEKM